MEEVGLFFEQAGVPRMAGRVLGYLLICDPPEQSTSQIIHALDASKASISTSTQLLLRMDFIEKVPMPGRRGTWYRIQAGAWGRALEGKLAMISIFRGVMDQGLAILADEPPERRARLEEARDLYAYFEEAFPRMIQEWKASRSET